MYMQLPILKNLRAYKENSLGSVVDPDPHRSAMKLVVWIRIPEGKRTIKCEKNSIFEVLDVLFLRTGGFSCSLVILHAIFDIKKYEFFQMQNFTIIGLVIKF
jgi:hypothetical protein